MMKSTMFPNVPLDPDTKITSQTETVIENIPVLIQRWSWDGISASSAIFHDEDVVDITDNKMFEMIVENCNPDEKEQYTIKRNQDGYTFLNFNFSYF